MIEYKDQEPRLVWTGTVHQGGRFSAIPVTRSVYEAIGRALVEIDEILQDNYTIDYLPLEDHQHMIRGTSAKNGYPVPEPVHVYIIPTTLSEV